LITTHQNTPSAEGVSEESKQSPRPRKQLWGAAEIGEYYDLTPRQAFYKLEKGTHRRSGKDRWPLVETNWGRDVICPSKKSTPAGWRRAGVCVELSKPLVSTSKHLVAFALANKPSSAD